MNGPGASIAVSGGRGSGGSTLSRPGPRSPRGVPGAGLLVLALAVPAILLLAPRSAAAQASAGEPGLRPSPDPSALRLAIANGVVSYVDGARVADVRMEWEPLPVDSLLLERARRHGVRPEVITFDNEALADGSWPSTLSRSARELLARSLRIPDLVDFDPGTADRAFRSYWTGDCGAGRDRVTTSLADAGQYYGALREQALVTSLLRTRGLTWSLDVRGAEPRGEFPLVSSEDVVWRLEVYRFRIAARGASARVGCEAVDGAGEPVDLYRFGLSARIGPVELVFPASEEREARLRVGLSLPGSPMLAESRWEPGAIAVTLDPAAEGSLRELEERGAATQLQTVLRFAAGTEMSELVTRGLLGGTRELSIVTGALVGRAEGIGYLVGVNWEELPGTPTGLLLGAVPGDGGSIFAGPSLRTDALTLSAGLQVLEREREEDDPALLGRPALALSLDLSRLLGGKRPRPPTTLRTSAVGGGWGRTSEALTRDLALAEMTLTIAPGTSLPEGFLLRRIADDRGRPLPRDRGGVVHIATDPPPDATLRFLPAGTYRYEGIPDHLVLRTGAGTVTNGDTARAGRERPWRPTWRLAPRPEPADARDPTTPETSDEVPRPGATPIP